MCCTRPAASSPVTAWSWTFTWSGQPRAADHARRQQVYRSIGPTARLAQRFHLAAGSTLEWLPQDHLLLGARASLDSRFTWSPVPACWPGKPCAWAAR
jgi:hypothetical protein